MTKNTPALWADQDADEFDGGSDIRDKRSLLGVPFLIGKVTFNRGDYGAFVSLTAVDAENNEFVMNDGSTGVYRQVVSYLHKKGMLADDIDKPETGEHEVRLVCRKGLRVSEYEGPGGKPASTFYLA